MNNEILDLSAEIADISSRLWQVLEQARELQPVTLAGNPRSPVYREDNAVLYHYAGPGANDGPPLLIVYSLINRPYILDLQPERSLIRALIDGGFSVYLLDWGTPESVDRFLTLDDYINGYLGRCVRTIAKRHPQQAVDLLGVCQGGVFALCFAALHPQRIGRVISLVTPVDFHAGEATLAQLARYVDADALVDTFGNISADLLNTLFVGLKPYRLLSQRYLDMAELAGNPAALREFLRMERWMYDSPDQAGEAYREYLKHFYQENGLIKGQIELGGRKVDLRNLTMPVFNIYAEADHLVPPEAARALGRYVNGPYQEYGFKGGHLGVFVTGLARRELYPAMIDWLRIQQ